MSCLIDTIALIVQLRQIAQQCVCNKLIGQKYKVACVMQQGNAGFKMQLRPKGSKVKIAWGRHASIIKNEG
jgi:hypothetical protein